MSYHGKVKPGGPADVRELADLVITKVSVGEYDNNAYLLHCRRTDEQLLIDAAAEPERLMTTIGDAGLATVVTTHQHGDHWQALEAIVEATGATTVMGADDAPAMPVRIDRTVKDGDTITVGVVEFEVIHLVGHTPGSIALLYDDPEGTPHLWTGDSLFPGGVGNTFGSEENFASLLNDVTTKLFDRLPDETWFYPGHGNDSTLGAERSHLPEWKERGW